MANKEHLAQLQQGVVAWNQWRDANRNRDFRPDLTGANLYEADLIEANLTRVRFYRADLRWADFCRADLTGADLYMADVGTMWVVGGEGGQTKGGNADLSVVQRLDTVRHSGPSTIGIDTLYRSKG